VRQIAEVLDDRPGLVNDLADFSPLPGDRGAQRFVAPVEQAERVPERRAVERPVDLTDDRAIECRAPSFVRQLEPEQSLPG